MHARHAVLDAGDMEETMHQVYLLPPQRAQFGRSETMPESKQDHGRVPVAMAVAAGSLHEPFDLTLGQVLTLAVMRVGKATAANCSLYRGWWLGLMGRIHWDNSPVSMALCSHNTSFENNTSTSWSIAEIFSPLLRASTANSI